MSSQRGAATPFALDFHHGATQGSKPMTTFRRRCCHSSSNSQRCMLQIASASCAPLGEQPTMTRRDGPFPGAICETLVEL